MMNPARLLSSGTGTWKENPRSREGSPAVGFRVGATLIELAEAGPEGLALVGGLPRMWDQPNSLDVERIGKDLLKRRISHGMDSRKPMFLRNFRTICWPYSARGSLRK